MKNSKAFVVNKGFAMPFREMSNRLMGFFEGLP